MDAFAVELQRQLPVGTPVTLIGPGAPAEAHARVAETISYELVTGIARSGERAHAGRSLVLELAREVLEGEEAWVVGGAVRDELLARPLNDLDIACREPERSARSYARRSGGAPFPLSERHGAWRVALDDGRTVDFTPLREGIEADLATRDFALNAIAVPVAGGEPDRPVRRARRHRGARDPGRAGLGLRGRSAAPAQGGAARGRARLPARRRERSGCFARATERVADPAGERILGELVRLSSDGFRRLDQLGLLAPLGGSLDGPLDARDEPGFRLVAVFGTNLERLPIANELRRYGRVLLRAERTGGRLAPRRAPLPPGDRAVGARRARLRGRGGVRTEPCSPARAGDPAAPLRARRRARPAARARRSGRSWRRSRRSGQPERSPRGKRRSSSRTV